jgi:hypothetical protein
MTGLDDHRTHAKIQKNTHSETSKNFRVSFSMEKFGFTEELFRHTTNSRQRP